MCLVVTLKKTVTMLGTEQETGSKVEKNIYLLQPGMKEKLLTNVVCGEKREDKMVVPNKTKQAKLSLN